MTTGRSTSDMKDKELVGFATEFLKAFAASAQSSSSADFDSSRPYALGAGGIVEITDEISAAQADFVHRSAKLLKSKAAHERAISKIVMDHAHKFVSGSQAIEIFISDMIKAVFEHGNSTFEYLAPNYLIRFDPAVREITMGRVRALLTEDFSAGWKARYPDHRLNVIPGKGFSIQMGEVVNVEMRAICWLVNVDAVAENVEEEGKWLIDVAVSFLRLSNQNWSGNFPNVGALEPHPLKAPRVHNEGVKFQNSRVLTGGGSVPRWYEIDAAVVATVQGSRFAAQASVIFDPPKKSLGERVSQGLGWLTRGRQSEDRAERLSYFFTAIEALLSTDDKTAPVVQTIARHAAVLLTDDNAARALYAKNIKTLYGFRSSLVHAGNRSILWSEANSAQILAEALFVRVLGRRLIKPKPQSYSGEFCESQVG